MTPAPNQQQHQQQSDDTLEHVLIFVILLVVALAVAPVALVAFAVAMGVEHLAWSRWRVALCALALATLGVVAGAHATYGATVLDMAGHVRGSPIDTASVFDPDTDATPKHTARADKRDLTEQEKAKLRADRKARAKAAARAKAKALAAWREGFTWWRLLGFVPGAVAFGPLAGLGLHAWWFHRNESEETVHARQVSRRRRSAKLAERRARTTVAWPTPPDRFVLGVPLGTTPLRGWVAHDHLKAYVAPLASVLLRHVVLLGETGSGKTWTAFGIAGEAARLGWPVIYLDGKADPTTRDGFVSAVEAHGVPVTDGSLHPINGWRGDNKTLANRLVAVQHYGDEWYRDIAQAVLPAAVGDEGVRGFDQLGERIIELDRDPEWRRHGPLSGMRREKASELLFGLHVRYAGVGAAVGDSLDGDWSYEDVPAAYVPVGRPEHRAHAAQVGAFMLEDLVDFVIARKPRDQHVLIIVDEFSKLSGLPDAAIELVERARAFNVAIVLVGQTWASLGPDEATRERIAGTVGTVIGHRLKKPEEVVALAGTEWQMERTEQTVDDWGKRRTGMGSQRAGNRYTVHPDHMRRLPCGEAFIIHEGHSLHMRARPLTGAGGRPRRRMVGSR